MTKHILLATGILLLYTAVFSQETEGINYRELVFKNDSLYYKTGDNEPYSGIVYQNYPNGKLFAQGPMKNGQLHGKWTNYFRNGNIKETGQFKHGKLTGRNSPKNTKIFYP